jgi:hypothetical protein
MDFSRALITDAQALPKDDGGDFRFDLLDWIADSGILTLTVQEREIQVREKYYRFAVRGDPKDGASLFGFGRSQDKKTAATIAVNEVLERFVSRTVLRDQSVSTPLQVTVQNGEIAISKSNGPAPMPTKGLHSSNGWAVHFSAKAAIDNAVREALERHILLISYLKHGWSGFLFDEPVPFSTCTLIPGIAAATAGGFKAGIVLTTGEEAPGATFGYLCAAGPEFEKSKRWLGAFFESYEQWTDLATRDVPSTASVIEQYQWHYLKGARPALPKKVAPELSYPVVNGNLAVFDLQSQLKSPFPLYAAFVFGGDFVPLFLSQNLSSVETKNVQAHLASLGVITDLPEFHPIL